MLPTGRNIKEKKVSRMLNAHSAEFQEEKGQLF